MNIHNYCPLLSIAAAHSGELGPVNCQGDACAWCDGEHCAVYTASAALDGLTQNQTGEQ